MVVKSKVGRRRYVLARVGPVDGRPDEFVARVVDGLGGMGKKLFQWNDLLMIRTNHFHVMKVRESLAGMDGIEPIDTSGTLKRLRMRHPELPPSKRRRR